MKFVKIQIVRRQCKFSRGENHSENTHFIQRDHIRILVIFFVGRDGSNDEQADQEPATKTYDGAQNSKPCRTFVVH